MAETHTVYVNIFVLIPVLRFSFGFENQFTHENAALEALWSDWSRFGALSMWRFRKIFVFFGTDEQYNDVWVFVRIKKQLFSSRTIWRCFSDLH